MSNIMICQQKLLKKADEQGYLTFDDIINVADTFELSVSEVDKLSEAIQLRNIIVYEECPENKSSTETLEDYSRVDYNAIFNELLSISEELQFIVKQVKELPPPQYGEVQILAIQVANNNKYAREHLILIHLRLALKIALSTAKQYQFDIVNAVSSAFIGLVVAVDKFDPNGFSTFQSYASSWIFQTIMRECTPEWIEYYYPAHYRDKMYNIIDKYRHFPGELYDGIISNDFILFVSKKIGISKEQAHDYLDAILKQMYGRIELNQKISPENPQLDLLKRDFDALNSYDSDGGNMELIEFLKSDISDYNPFKKLYVVDLKEQLNKMMSSLTYREKEIINLRFGLKDGKECTLEEVGNVFGVTRERIRQIEVNAFRKLKNPEKIKYIKDYI